MSMNTGDYDWASLYVWDPTKQSKFTPHTWQQWAIEFSRVFLGPPRSLTIMQWKAQTATNKKDRDSKDTPNPIRNHNRGQTRSALDPKRQRVLSSSHLTILLMKTKGINSLQILWK